MQISYPSYRFKLISLIFLSLCFSACRNSSEPKTQKIPVIGFLDAFVDETLDQAHIGYLKALEDSGFSEKNKTVEIIYRNAQGEIPALVQACQYFVAQKVDVIAANSTISTVTAAKNSKGLPVCMMVAPDPVPYGLQENGKGLPFLFGVYETLSYIDTSVTLIKQMFPEAKKIGVIYNQAEPQSVRAFNTLSEACRRNNIDFLAKNVSNSSETSSVTEALMAEGIDAFFALPDNTVFASFELIDRLCTAKNIPVFTSEAGLVKRGALCAYGADMYEWGYQAGLQTVAYLKSNFVSLPAPETVKKRSKTVNEAKLKLFKK